MKVQKLVQTELRQEKKCHLVTDKKDVVKVCKIVNLWYSSIAHFCFIIIYKISSKLLLTLQSNEALVLPLDIM